MADRRTNQRAARWSRDYLFGCLVKLNMTKRRFTENTTRQKGNLNGYNTLCNISFCENLSTRFPFCQICSYFSSANIIFIIQKNLPRSSRYGHFVQFYRIY